jgi:putative addiction module component (TIGR02574 family)
LRGSQRGLRSSETDERLLELTNMRAHFDDIEKQARSLPLKEKAALVGVLIDQLDAPVDSDSEQLWIAEAQRRYDAYRKGDLEALPGDDVMDRVRNRLR